ncbi:MAG: hypothetical protein J4400_04360 [Candidatus Aenigmarchaeota archaeon]|nr:hypothetical protein [Candidatus Aenigmarchaeota archaeon]
MADSYSGKGILSFFLEKFHPFASVAAQHHGTFVEPYVARNMAELGGYEGEFDELVVGSESSVSRILIGRDVVLHVSASYPVDPDGLILPSDNEYKSASRTFSFETPEWLMPLHPERPETRLFRLKCGLDRELYRTSWIRIGNEIGIAGEEGIFAHALVGDDGEFLYKCDVAENQREIDALLLAGELGFEIGGPVRGKDSGASAAGPGAKAVHRMQESMAYRQG